jgi:acetyl-CoA carboxylase biotin carboxyl carrier protein
MDLSYDEVQNILKIIDASSLEELHLEIGEFKLVVKKRSGRSDRAAPAAAATGAEGLAAAAPAASRKEGAGFPAASSDPGGRPSSPDTDGVVHVRAPMVGTFYRAPAPAAPPFVEVGTKVEPDDVVCIIEVMKLMNSIRAGRRGRVVEILADDGELVEYGQPLVVIELLE